MTSSKCPYRSKHQVIILTVYIYITVKPCTSHKTSTACFSPAHEYTSSHILHIYGVSMVICGGLLTSLAAANHHKPPPKCLKYAGFGTIGIPAIRESIVLYRQSLATLKEPNYLLLSQIMAVVCSGLPAFHCFHYLSLFLVFPLSGVKCCPQLFSPPHLIVFSTLLCLLSSSSSLPPLLLSLHLS